MSDNYMQVKSSSTIGSSTNFVPDVTDSYWEPAWVTDSDWDPGDGGDQQPSPYTIGFRVGDKVLLTDPLASGPNHNTRVTVVGLSGTFPDRVIEVLETLSSPDSTDYEFRIEKTRSKYLIE